ncbi:MAG: Mur ligase family protein [Planctomycetota bacterium]
MAAPVSLSSLSDALDYLASFTDYEQKDAARMGRDSLDLERMRALLRDLGQPEAGRPYFHIAGSKGKGSTALALRALASASGLKTGLFLSPHLMRVNERISIDGQDILDADFCRQVQNLAQVVEPRRQAEALELPSFFESMVAMAFLEFRDKACDLAVMEVGLGGRLDATNIITPAVSLITAIDLEHTRILGSTLEEIAREKAGIIKPQVPVISSLDPQSPSGRAVAARASALDAPAEFLGRGFRIENRRDLRDGGQVFDLVLRKPDLKIEDLVLSLDGVHQAENLALAAAAFHRASADSLLPTAFDEKALRSVYASLRLPGRLEFIEEASFLPQPVEVGIDPDHKFKVLIDSAHTPASMRALARWIELRAPEKSITLALGMLRDKDLSACLLPLQGKVAAVWTVRPNSPRALDHETLAEAVITVLGDVKIRNISGGPKGLAAAISTRKPALLVVTGSVYLSGGFRALLAVV